MPDPPPYRPHLNSNLSDISDDTKGEKGEKKLGETLVVKDGGPIRRRLKRPQTYIIHQLCVRPGQLQSLVP